MGIIINSFTSFPATTPSFVDAYGVSKSITTGTGQGVYIADSDGHFKFTDDDAFSYSFWVRPGWNSSLNTRQDLFSMSDVGASNSNANTIRMWYYEPHNRIWIEWRDSSGNKKQNFWLFHSNSGNYAAAYQASGGGWWREDQISTFNADSNGYSLITFTKGSTNSAANSNINLYWNGTTCGSGFYANGGGSGTPNMTNTNDKLVALGSASWSGMSKCGNNNETKFNDLSIWNKKLSASEVAEIYNSGTKIDLTTHSAAGNLKGYYKFENNGNDSSGNSAPAFTVNGNSNYVST